MFVCLCQCLNICMYVWKISTDDLYVCSCASGQWKMKFNRKSQKGYFTRFNGDIVKVPLLYHSKYEASMMYHPQLKAQVSNSQFKLPTCSFLASSTQLQSFGWLSGQSGVVSVLFFAHLLPPNWLWRLHLMEGLISKEMSMLLATDSNFVPKRSSLGFTCQHSYKKKSSLKAHSLIFTRSI